MPTENFKINGVYGPIRSDNGPEFKEEAVKSWQPEFGVQTPCIGPGSPWENRYCECFDGKLQDELFNREIFDSLKDVQILTEEWRQEFNNERPHTALGQLAPARFALGQLAPARFALARQMCNGHEPGN